jgi:hypothetical protein
MSLQYPYEQTPTTSKIGSHLAPKTPWLDKQELATDDNRYLILNINPCECTLDRRYPPSCMDIAYTADSFSHLTQTHQISLYFYLTYCRSDQSLQILCALCVQQTMVGKPSFPCTKSVELRDFYPKECEYNRQTQCNQVTQLAQILATHGQSHQQ